ncbi:MAG: GDCCVxC domain-containing (seleno)protein [Cyclobacteriaceae bacterium]
MEKEIELQSTIACPECGYTKLENMPQDACQYFYECTRCKKIIKPLAGDCCVYCSYGSNPCPPVQKNGKNCCN